MSGNDFPDVVGVAFIYDLPRLPVGNGLLSRITNGFTLSSVYRFNSGQVYTPFQPLYARFEYGRLELLRRQLQQPVRWRRHLPADCLQSQGASKLGGLLESLHRPIRQWSADAGDARIRGI